MISIMRQPRVKNKRSLNSRAENQNKNLMILKLLSCVPEFKKDVKDIRTEMAIKIDGFRWDDSEMWEWASKKNLEYYQGLPQGDEEEGTDHIGLSSKDDEDVRKTFPSNFFEKRMLDLGTKYKLPFNFYAFPCDGLSRYILSGEIKADHPNYFTNFHEAKDRTLWTSLTAYMPLSGKELKDAMKEWQDDSMGILSALFEGVDALSKKRYRNKIDRDLFLIKEQIKRSSKPKKIKRYKQGSYLDILSKDQATSTKRKKILEHQNKKDVLVEYDNLTSKQIGKSRGVTGDTTRQAKKRLNLLAKGLFGFDLEL